MLSQETFDVATFTLLYMAVGLVEWVVSTIIRCNEPLPGVPSYVIMLLSLVLWPLDVAWRVRRIVLNTVQARRGKAS